MGGGPHPYDALVPGVILDAVERLGVRCDGRLLPLASYENRVYQVGVEEGAPLVAKFYRPGRWPDAAILEEHAFAFELAEREIPVVAPLEGPQGRTLLEHRGFRYALYPWRGGRAPELDRPGVRAWLGRFLGRIHALGAVRRFERRPALTVERYGWRSLERLDALGALPDDLAPAYRSVAGQALGRIEADFAALPELRRLRVHGDCHVGNILWTDAGPHFVDLDDTRMGPAVQDLWMLVSESREEQPREIEELLSGYTLFHDFDRAELVLIEGLRTLRLVRYAAWLASRWDDPAFPPSFPWFGTRRYWEDQIEILRGQVERLQEP